jgi:hypothetical protein
MQRFEAGGVVHYSVPADFAAGSFVAGKKPGISTDVHLGGCTLTFTSGLLTGKSGEC